MSAQFTESTATNASGAANAAADAKSAKEAMRAGFAKLAAQIKTEAKEVSEAETIDSILRTAGSGDFDLAFYYYVRTHHAENFEQKFRLMARILDHTKAHHPELYLTALEKAVGRAIEYSANYSENIIGPMVNVFLAQQANIASVHRPFYVGLMQQCEKACDKMILADEELAKEKKRVAEYVAKSREYYSSQVTSAEQAAYIKDSLSQSDEELYYLLTHKLPANVLYADALIAKAAIVQFLASKQSSQANAFAAAAASAGAADQSLPVGPAADATAAAQPILPMATAAAAKAPALTIVVADSATAPAGADAIVAAAHDAAAAAAPSRSIAADAEF